MVSINQAPAVTVTLSKNSVVSINVLVFTINQPTAD